MSDGRWTVRGVAPSAIAILREARQLSGMTIGTLLMQAIEVWRSDPARLALLYRAVSDVRHEP